LKHFVVYYLRKAILGIAGVTIFLEAKSKVILKLCMKLLILV